MPQAETLDLKEKPVEKEKWSARKLFGLLAPVAAVAKVMSVFDTVGGICLFVLILFIGTGEAFGHGVSWLVYLLAFFCAVIHLGEKNLKLKSESLPPKT